MLVREHRALVAVLAAAVAVRVAVAVAYWPALFYSDSWAYLSIAYAGFPAGFEPARPSGYPALIRLITLPTLDVGLVTTLQHLAGLAIGVLLYALMTRLNVPRPWAAVVAAVVLLDAWAIALEQRLLAETFFTLTMLLVVAFAVRSNRTALLTVACGLLLGAAATLRGVALVAVPVLLVYLAWTHRSWRPPAVALAAVALPLALYGAAHAAVTGSFGLTESNGWFMYGRVAEFADCRQADVPPDARILCQPTDHPDRDRGVAFYLWNPDAPARRELGGMGTPGSNELTGRFARAVILAQPGDYLATVAADTTRFFTPGQSSLGRSDEAITLPEAPGQATHDQPIVRERHIPGYEPPARPPAAALHAYAKVMHLPRPVLAALTIFGLVAVVLGLTRHDRIPHRREIFILIGTGLALVVGAAATSEFVLRYLIPAAPLLLAGGAIAASDLLDRRGAVGRRADARRSSAPTRPG